MVKLCVEDFYLRIDDYLIINNPGLTSFDIEKFNINNQESDVLLTNLEKKTKNYDKYIKNNIVIDQTLLGIDQAIRYLNNSIHSNV